MKFQEGDTVKSVSQDAGARRWNSRFGKVLFTDCKGYVFATFGLELGCFCENELEPVPSEGGKQ